MYDTTQTRTSPFFGGLPVDPDLNRLRQKWPYASMQVGDTIEDDEVADVINVDPETKAGFRRLKSVTDKWRRAIKKQSIDEDGHILLGRRGGRFVVFSANEIVDSQQQKVRTAGTYIKNAHAMGCIVDREKLDDDHRRVHDHHEMLTGKMRAVLTAHKLSDATA